MALWDKDCMVYSCYNARLLNHTVPLCDAHTAKVVGIVSFVFAQLKGSDCVGARAGNEKGSSPAHGGAVAASACEYKKGQTTG